VKSWYSPSMLFKLLLVWKQNWSGRR
jgi:hypothetical protein